MIHYDVRGSSHITTQYGIHWYITFVDDCRTMTKSDMRAIFKTFYCMICNQYSLLDNVFKSKKVGQYRNSQLSQFFKIKNKKLHSSWDNLSPNSATKWSDQKKNLHILKITRLFLIGVCAFKTYWDDAVTYAIHLLNCMASRVLSFRTSLAALADHVTLSSSLQLDPKVFCCVTYICLHNSRKQTWPVCNAVCLS